MKSTPGDYEIPQGDIRIKLKVIRAKIYRRIKPHSLLSNLVKDMETAESLHR
jgi:hypothetical protein